MDDKLLTITDAAQMLNISRQSLYRWAKDGKIQMIKIADNATRIKQSDIERLINEATPIYQDAEQIQSVQQQIPLGYMLMAAYESDIDPELIGKLSDKMAEIMQSKTDQEAIETWIKHIAHV